jgi:FMN-dependent NADH-azoreductase
MVPHISGKPERALHVSASPRGEQSNSIAIADAFLAEYRRQREVNVDRIDVFADLVPFAARQAEAKMAVIGGQEVPAGAAEAWAETLAVADRLLRADLLIVSTPMWNGGVPWALKLFIDIVTQPRVSFRFDPSTGYQGLLGGRRAVSVYTSRIYSPGVERAFGVDYQSTYLRWWLEYVGIDEIHELRLQPTFPGDDFERRRAKVVAAARELAREMADVPRSGR